MPIYEYKCDNCGDLFEVRQKFADEPLTAHEKCGGPVRRLMSTPSFNFKGSGWYVTDYGKGSNGSKKSDKEKSDKDSKESKEGKESKPSTDTKSETKSSTESKPATSDKSKSE